MDLDKLQAICEAATVGPWTDLYGYDDNNVYVCPGQFVLNREDIKFIAAAREYMPKLINILDELLVGVAVIGHKYRNDWSEFDGRILKRELEELEIEALAKLEGNI